MTPPPGATGGLLNAIVGSLHHDGARRRCIGTPIGILAGTYLAEYGRHDRLDHGRSASSTTSCSAAPSIVIGLFVYAVVVAPMGALLRLGRRGGAGA